MGGISSSSASSEQSAQAFLSQQFYGSCDITCTNIQSNINIDIINSIVGGDINLTQQCSVNANCMVSGSSDATSDVLFKATNSSNAKDTGGLFGGNLFNIDKASSMSRQDIKQTILQSTTENCKLATLNQMNDITILAANSVIGGSINIGQTGSTAGQCQLQNNLTAAATATALASNTATSGKDKKGQKKGGSTTLITAVIFIGALAVIYILARMYVGNAEETQQQQNIQEVEMARAKAGCPGGLKPILNSKGSPIIDPLTRKPICPPLDIKPVSPTINVDVGKSFGKKRK